MFRANPVPAGIFDGPMGIPERHVLPVTVPMSPAISKPALNKSIRHAEPQEEFEFKAQPMPDFSEVFEPVRPHTHTEAEPFAVAEKYGDAYQKREQLRLEAETAAAALREFHANPLPDLNKVDAPIIQPATLTVVEPFNLHSEALHEQYQQQWAEKLAQQQEEEHKKAEFHAQKLPMTAPFVPKKLTKAATKV